MRKIVSMALFCMAALSTLKAHEFWLQPDKFIFAAGTNIVLSFWVGENFTGEYWANRKSRTERLIIYGMDTRQDLTDAIPAGDATPLTTSLTQAGTYMVYMHSKPSYIELDAEKFNAYLKEDGIDDILQQRAANGESSKPAREKYERYSKAFLQCGAPVSNVHDIRTGARLEFSLLFNPYEANRKDKDTFRVMVEFDGRALPQKQVSIWLKDKKGRLIDKKNSTTDENGICTFVAAKDGIYMISTVHMIDAVDSSYDYHSFWGSVTFEHK